MKKKEQQKSKSNHSSQEASRLASLTLWLISSTVCAVFLPNTIQGHEGKFASELVLMIFSLANVFAVAYRLDQKPTQKITFIFGNDQDGYGKAKEALQNSTVIKNGKGEN